MAASACIVPGPNPSSPCTAAEGLPGLPPGRGVAQLRKAGIAFALTLWALCGFASGVALSVVALPETEVSSIASQGPPRAFGRRAVTRRSEPRFWRPSGSTAVRPIVQLSARVYQPGRRGLQVASGYAGAH